MEISKDILKVLDDVLKLKYAPFEIRNKQDESLNSTMMAFKTFLNAYPYPILKEIEEEKSKEREDWKIT